MPRGRRTTENQSRYINPQFMRRINNQGSITELQDEQSIYDTCIICSELLDNVNGPNNNQYCRTHCNDVVNVCPNNHKFHRGCILRQCNTTTTEISGIFEGQRYTGNIALANASKCPLCRAPLITRCTNFRNVTKVPTEELATNTGGRRRRKRRTNKHRTNKRRTNRRNKNRKTCRN